MSHTLMLLCEEQKNKKVNVMRKISAHNDEEPGYFLERLYQ